MEYPTSALEVKLASHFQLCKWWRFLHSPSSKEELAIMSLICRRVLDFGGFTLGISKELGWDE